MDAEDRSQVAAGVKARSSQEQAMSDNFKDQVQWAAWGILMVGFIVYAIGTAVQNVL